jgi:hypothetical protein
MSSSKVTPIADRSNGSDGQRASSKKKIEANRKNARLSTGPRTVRGKRIVSRNALKHGLLAREVIITAGDGQEKSEEFSALQTRLWDYYQPAGAMEEMLVEKIATCWWRLARVMRAENGEIRKSLDAATLESFLHTREELSWNIMLVGNQLAGRTQDFDPKLSPRERMLALRKCQSSLARDSSGLMYLRAVLLSAKQELKETGRLSEACIDSIDSAFGLSDHPFVYHCALLGQMDKRQQGKRETPELDKKDTSMSSEEDKTIEARPAIEALVRAIDDQLKLIERLSVVATIRAPLEEDAKIRSLGLPPSDAADKIMRYETHLERQLHRAMDQLERLQRQRRGEAVPPPLNINLGRRG